MPNVGDIVNIAEHLQNAAVLVQKDRCIAVRNRNASCRRCQEVCPGDAIQIKANELRYTAAFCIGCGACTSRCPTQALVSTKPTDAELTQAAVDVTLATGGVAVFACARIASKKLANPATYAEVPCLARVDSATVLTLAAHGAKRLVMVDGNCTTCKYHKTDASTSAVIDDINALLAAGLSGLSVERYSTFPPEMQLENTQGMFGTSRRAFFSDAANAARDTAMTAAKATINQELGVEEPKEAEIGIRLRVTADGKLPEIGVRRHDALIDALDQLGMDEDAVFRSEQIGCVTIDPDACNACGMCAVFCPTHALRRDPTDKAQSALNYIEYSASDCVGCMMCRDVCWKKALTNVHEIRADELFSFEPRVFTMAGKASPFSPMFKFS